MRLPLAVGAAQALAVGRQRGFRRLSPCDPTVQGGLQGLRVSVGQGPMQRGSGRGMVATGRWVAPSAEGAQLLLVQSAGIAPSGVDTPVPGQARQLPDRQQGRQLELAALGSAVIRDGGELLQQRRQRDRVRTHRLRALRLPGGARLGRAQAFSGPSPKRIDVHLLEVTVGLGVATVAAREPAGEPDRPPVSGPIQGAGEPLRIDEGLGQLQRMTEGRLPVGAQAPQIGRHHPGGQIGESSGRGQHQQAGVVGNQPQAGELLSRAPADPTVARPALEGARLPTDQGQPTLLVFGHIAQTATGELPESQIVLLGHGGIPAATLIGAHQPESDVLDRGGQDEVRWFHAGGIPDPA